MSEQQGSASTTAPTTPVVEALEHADTRANIPSGEQREFVAEDERRPVTVRYGREIYEPELVWQQKADGDLEVPAVPIYIQERIEPRAIVEGLRHGAEPPSELQLFDDFDGTDGFESIDFYEHEDNWSNRMILGDSLLVMNSLAEKEHMRGKVQMIYLDPPYGISFGSNWQVSTRKRNVTDGKAEDATRQPEQVKAYRDTWELGINSYLSYLRDRFIVCRELLTETGSIFVQIGEDNVHLVRSLLDEVFGADCSVVTIVFKKKGNQKSSLIDPVNDYLLWFSKNPRESTGVGPKFRALFEPRQMDAGTLRQFSRVELADGSKYPIAAVPDPAGEVTDYRNMVKRLLTDYPGSRLYKSSDVTNGGERRNQMDPVEVEGTSYSPTPGRCWSHTSRGVERGLSGMERLARAGRLLPTGRTLGFKRYLEDFGHLEVSNWWDHLGGASNPVYVVQTNPEVVKRCILMTTDPGDLVLDPTCGSGTTAYVAEQWGRRWITTDTSRVALALARTRLMAAKHPYFILADSIAGAAKIAKLSKTRASEGPFTEDVRKGFVYKLARRVTSGLFANCASIDECETAEEAEAAALAEAPSEPLVDQPYEDRKRVRVTGRFTMESLSPHRTLESSDEDGAAPNGVLKPDFEPMIVENVRSAGVQNTYAGQRLKFDRLDLWSGQWIHAEGEFTDHDGERRRVAVSIGPEHGTVGPEQVLGAGREALRGAGFDLLVVLGFAFDALASEEAKAFGDASDAAGGFAVAAEERTLGSLRVLLARMNPDLAMGHELLKKTGTGNLFMVFGEPDIDVRRVYDEASDADNYIVEINGLDVYDPTTGQVRSSSTDDIACWFIDTNYDDQGFCVRHAYFTGAGDPYAQLARTLRAEICPEAWASLYSTTSRPFPSPVTGKIAVKAINHYGDEILQVYSVP